VEIAATRENRVRTIAFSTQPVFTTKPRSRPVALGDDAIEFVTDPIEAFLRN